MQIALKQFGTTLISRPAGRESWLALQPLIKDIQTDEIIEVDFDGVLVLTPSWADEFISPLLEKYKKRVHLKNSINPSVKATLETLKKAKESLQ